MAETNKKPGKRLTGERFYAIMQRSTPGATEPWERLEPEIRQGLDEIAAEMDLVLLAPLREVIRDYIAFTAYHTPIVKQARDAWYEQSVALKVHAQQVLGETSYD